MKLSVIVGCLVLISFMLTSWVDVVEADAVEIDVSYESDPLYDSVNIPTNLVNATHTDSVIYEWERDCGPEMPNGTYYGALTQPGLFTHNLRPVEIVEDNTDGGYLPDVNGSVARYTTVIVSAHFNWSKQVLMSGCSEWWVRIPVHPDSIGDFAYLSIFKDVDNASLIDFYSYYNFTPKVAGEWEFYPDFIRPTYDGQMPQDIFKYASGQSIGFSYYTYAHGEMVKSEDHVYLKVHSILRPETDYVISYAFYIPEDEVLSTYWNTGETPCGGWSSIVVGDTEIEHIFPGVGDTIYYQTTVVDSQKTEVPLDLDYSFIFVQGIGPGGLFGARFQIESTIRNCSAEGVPYPFNIQVWGGIVDYPFYNSSMDDPEYMSFMLPFISDDRFYCVPRVDSAMLLADLLGWRFMDGEIYFRPEWGWNYSDFILFSTSSRVNYTDPFNDPFFDGFQWNIKTEYEIFENVSDEYRKSINITLLCYESPRSVHDWSEIDWEYGFLNQEMKNSSFNPWLRPYVYTWDGREYGRKNESGDYRYNLGMTYSYLGYEIWQSARGTEEQWVLRNMTSSGEYTYSYHFPQIIHLSSHTWVVGSSIASRPVTPWGNYWQMSQDAWNTGHRFQAIYYAVRGTISYLFDGLPGIIYDALHGLWDEMKKFGSWIYTRIVEFIGKIYDFLEDVGDHLVDFWESAKYAVAPIIMIVIISYGSRFANTARRDIK